MKIIWWNLGYPFYWKLWRRIIIGRWDCFFLPRDGGCVCNWLQNNSCDVFLGCEVVSEHDARSLSCDTVVSSDWVPSRYHSHGRIMIADINIKKKVVQDPDFTTEWYDMETYYIAPVHLHYSRPETRLFQARALVRAANTLDKPAVIIGDFNIWMVWGRWFLFDNDKQAYKLLVNNFADVSVHIANTIIVPFIKLDYVFVSPEMASHVSVSVLKCPVPGTDHFPFLLEFDETVAVN